MAPRNSVTTTISFGGPFFAHDPSRTFRQNVRVMMDAVAAEGEADVRAQLAAGESHRAPVRALGRDARVRLHVVGRTKSLEGKRWAVSAVVSPLNQGFTKRGGKALMAAASEIEGRDHIFRKTTNRLRRSRAVNSAELLKGLR